MKVQTTTMDIQANDVLKTEARKNYYLIIGENEKKVVINVGKKTYDQVTALIEDEKTIKQPEQELKKGGK